MDGKSLIGLDTTRALVAEDGLVLDLPSSSRGRGEGGGRSGRGGGGSGDIQVERATLAGEAMAVERESTRLDRNLLRDRPLGEMRRMGGQNRGKVLVAARALGEEVFVAVLAENLVTFEGALLATREALGAGRAPEAVNVDDGAENDLER